MSTKNELIQDYIPLAKSICKRYVGLDYDDRYQQAVLGLTVAAEKFNSDKGNFGSYARVVIKSYLNKLYNKEQSNDDIPTDWNNVEDNSDEESNFNAGLLQDTEDRYQRFEILESIKQQLSTLHYDIAYLKVVKQYNQEECANELGVSQATISRRLEDIKEEFKNV